MSAERAEARATTCAAPSAPVDLVHLSSMTLGDRTLELEVLGMFVRQSSSTMSKLADMTDPAACHETVHTLKGSARSVGAHKVAFVCEGVEAECQAGSVPSMAALSQAVDEANGYIRTLLDA